MVEITIPLRSHDEAILVLGPYDRFAKLLRQALDIDLSTAMGNLRLRGGEEDVAEAQRRIEHLLGKARKGRELGVREIESILMGKPEPAAAPTNGAPPSRRVGHPGVGRVRVRPVEPRGENQRRYLELLEKRQLVFGVGPAGTGKTYLAVARAVRMLRAGEVRRLVITRPVVEAGEHLGFLPGDVHQKLNPYMRPIYDALFDLIDGDDLARLEEAGVIEVAPLAYMRGRTLSHAFVILDEGQNTTIGQMKMFLTRMGEGSVMAVTGDPSQNDLPPRAKCGLVDAVQRLRGFEGVGVLEFGLQDVVRHPLVAQIVRAYQAPSRVPVREEDEDDEAGAALRQPMTVRVTWDVEVRPMADDAAREAVEAALEHGGRAGLDVDVVFTSDPTLADLHARFLGDPAPTDVIAFDLGDEGTGPAAELYASVDCAVRTARRRSVPVARELALYLVHGALHLCGLDDGERSERQAMRAAECVVLARLGYPEDPAPHDDEEPAGRT